MPYRPPARLKTAGIAIQQEPHKGDRMTHKLSRRHCIKLVASAGISAMGALWVGGCAPKETPTPTEEPVQETAAEREQPVAASKGKIELRYMDRSGPVGDFMRYASRVYEERNPDITVINETTAWGDLQTKVPTMVAGGTVPDVVFQHGALMLPELAAKGAWLNLEPVAERDNHDFSIYYDWALDTLRLGPNGELVAMPNGVNQGETELHWNRELLQDFGLAEPHDKMTIAELTELFIKIQEKMPDNGFAAHYGTAHWPVEGIARAFGGYLISHDRTSVGFSLPETQDALSWQYDLINKYKVMPTQEQVLQNATSMFFAGMLATTFNCSANIWSGFEQAVEGRFSLGHCLWPKGDTGWGITPSCDANVAYAKTKYPDEAWGLLKLLSSFEISKWTAISESHMTPGAVIEAWHDPEVWEACPPYKDCALAYDTIPWGEIETWSMPVPANTRRAEFNDLFSNEWSGMLYGQRPYDQSNIDALQAELQAIVDKPMP